MNRRELISAALLTWAFAATALVAAGARGGPALLVIAPFCLFGVGVALAAGEQRSRRIAETLVLVVAVGIGTATVVAQTLLLLGVFHPVAVIGVLAVIVGVIVATREARVG